MIFNPNWNTDAVLHHLASQIYFRAWKHGNSSVYYIEKNNVNLEGNLSRHTKKFAFIKNFFSRKAGAYFSASSDCEKYFELLKGYEVVFKGEKIKDPLKLNKIYRCYDEWIIYDSNLKIISKSEKEKLKLEIDDIHVRDIEVGWDRLYENKWSNVRDDIQNVVDSNKGAIKIPSVRREELVKFMVSLEWRTKPNHPVLEESFERFIKNTEFLKPFLNELIHKDERMYPFIDTEKEFINHNLLLSYYHQFLNNRGPIYDEAEKIIKHMNIELLIATKGTDFITSDNPVCRFQNRGNDTEYIFPITPTIACAVRKGPYDGSHYFVSYLNKDDVFKYNQKLKNNCYAGYVLRQPSLNPYFNVVLK